ncbi:Mitochondrial distribution and morphology protein 10 [Gnomoniopsis smithogilvyi]|uniref:Mitochondrial distribution and morphology protein 10 n=1 Tax=Gnomoniopsis smithogilvyi TaxID=1191159 RepID=A0A9W8YV62_9PEZI|nr:Mitochondrial distribution and morphology protein 10 [Gnomoniopsis smithogilvyi]
MRDFLGGFLQEAFIKASGGNVYDNSYSNLDLTARSLLGFPTPSGSRISLSSFVRPKFGTSYSIGIKDGWISYLYSSHPLKANTVSSSDRISLQDLLQCYRSLSINTVRHTVGHTLIYGRLYLPQSRLEALLSARVSPQVNLTLRAVSQQSLPHGGTLLGLASWDDPAGRFGVESVASSDGGVLGLRGLWNVTNPSSVTDTTALEPGLSSSGGTVDSSSDKERINGRLSAGGEFYYGLLNKSGGFSVGTRFQTLPTHHGTPLTATLTFNLLGHMSLTYSVLAGDCTLATEFGFNAYSYESDWAVGMELWNKRKPRAAVIVPEQPSESPVATPVIAEEIDTVSSGAPQTTTKVTEVVTFPGAPARARIRERSFQAKLEWRLDDNEVEPGGEHDTGEAAADQATPEGPAGVLKWRCDQRMRMGLLYEGRYKSLLFSLGTDINLKKLDAPFRTVGLAVQFSS